MFSLAVIFRIGIILLVMHSSHFPQSVEIFISRLRWFFSSVKRINLTIWYQSFSLYCSSLTGQADKLFQCRGIFIFQIVLHLQKNGRGQVHFFYSQTRQLGGRFVQLGQVLMIIFLHLFRQHWYHFKEEDM